MIAGKSDVLIIGAGPGGCAAGITLARAGVNVCVVDRARFPRPNTCGDAVSNKAVELMRRLGAWPRLQRRPRAEVRTAAAVFPDGSRVERRYEAPGLIVPRLGLDDALRETLEDAGARLLQEVHVRTVTPAERPGGPIAAAGESAAGQAFGWSAPVLIAADGPGSVAWRAVRRPYPRGRYLAIAATEYYEGVEFPHGPECSDHYFEHDLPFGYGWVFPAVEGVTNVGVYQRADAYERAGTPLKSLLRRFLERHRERLGRARRVGELRTWALPLGQAPWPAVQRGILFVGDAGGFIDPLSGEGIWQALRTGELAAEIARRAVARGGVVSTGLAKEYERSCRDSVGRDCNARARLQRAMQWVLELRLYRLRVVRGLLGWGYRRGSLQGSKTG